jgi:large subunit ribosomal protein L30
MAEKNKKLITIIQTGSAIARGDVQRGTLIGLGLGKIGKQKTLEDTQAVRGMISKVSHLVEIIEN